MMSHKEAEAEAAGAEPRARQPQILLNYITRKMPRKEKIRWRAVMSHGEAVMSHEEDAAEGKDSVESGRCGPHHQDS